MKVDTNSSKACQALNIVLQQWNTHKLAWNENHLWSRQQELENYLFFDDALDITGSTSGSRIKLLQTSMQEAVDHVSTLLTDLYNETPATFASQLQV